MLYSQCNIFDIFLNIFVRRQTILLGIGWWVSGREGCGSLLTTDLSDDCTQLPSGSVPTRFWLTKIIIFNEMTLMRKFVLLTMSVAAGAAMLMTTLTGCNVTRTVTTSSSYVQRGDTTVLIQSKTIESYDATKKL